MAIPRPVLLGIVGGVLILLALVATRVTGGEKQASTPAPVAPSTSPAPTAGGPKPAATKPAHRQSRPPVAVSRALAQRKPLVIFFGQKGGADDAGTRTSVKAMRHTLGAKVTVVTDTLAHIDRYGAVVRELGIDQAPAVAIIDRGKQGRVVSGYVDAGTLTQTVRDVIR